MPKAVLPLAIVHEHPQWFLPLFAALDRRGLPWTAVRLQDHVFELDEAEPPARLVFNRLAMSAFLRQREHPLYYAQALYAHWESRGAEVINGGPALAIDLSKARQLSLIRSLGLGLPRTRVIHRAADAVRAAEGLRFPLLVKANIGGAGAGIVRFDSPAALSEAAGADALPRSVDGVLLVQEYVPARDRQVIRVETLAGRYLYALALNSDSGSFDLCPADVCLTDKPRLTVAAHRASDEVIAEVEAIARAAGLDVGGVEYVVDDRDGIRRYFDINALSNFVARPLDVLGFDPHERLIDYLQQRMAGAAARSR
ncbi:MAG: hypothetical protein MEQ07_10950 [Aquimonas sp.]|nr:hypothetical protein [Aquimonas sp.]